MINWGIIGCGDVCEKKSGPAFYKIEGSALVAVMRRNRQKAADFAHRHNVSRFYTSAEELLADSDLQAVYIATPPYLHMQYALQALKARKTVYVEKPMAMTYAECQQMAQVAQENNQKLYVAYYRRSLDYFLKVKQLIENGSIGKISSVSIRQFRQPSSADFESETQTWRTDPRIAGGGYFMDLAPHTIDMLDFLVGKITDAQGFASNIGQLYDAEDSVAATFKFQNGAIGTGLWSFVTEHNSNQDTVEILGTKGKLQFSIFDFAPIKYTSALGTETYETKQPQHIQQPLIQSIIDELNGKGTCPSNYQNGMRASWVIDKIFGRL